MLIKNKELNNMDYKNKKSEKKRLFKLYNETLEKYDRKIDALWAKRDYEVDYIWKEICKLEGGK